MGRDRILRRCPEGLQGSINERGEHDGANYEFDEKWKLEDIIGDCLGHLLVGSEIRQRESFQGGREGEKRNCASA